MDPPRPRDVVASDVLELPGARLTATLSLAKDEWGMVVATDDGAVWNQVDTVLRNPAHVRSVAEDAARRVGRPNVDLALVRWQPMLEVAAQLGDRISFPLRTYADLLAQIVAVGASAAVPNACGASHAGPFGWLDHVFYPVSQQRFLAELADYEADLDGFPAGRPSRAAPGRSPAAPPTARETRAPTAATAPREGDARPAGRRSRPCGGPYKTGRCRGSCRRRGPGGYRRRVAAPSAGRIEEEIGEAMFEAREQRVLVEMAGLDSTRHECAVFF